jgi:hypothetical protein
MTRTEDILVQKRDGRLEKIDLDKIHQIGRASCRERVYASV